MSFRIKELWAFTAIGSDNEEGVVAIHTSTGSLPLVASDRIRLNDLMPIAKRISKESKMRIVVSKFSVREIVEEIVPNETN